LDGTVVVQVSNGGVLERWATDDSGRTWQPLKRITDPDAAEAISVSQV
jgi:hypothetical protein